MAKVVPIEQKTLYKGFIDLLTKEFPENETIIVFGKETFNQMKHYLPTDLRFHDLSHTFHATEGVLAQYLDYAKIMNFSLEEKEEGAVAAIEHDEAFTQQYFNNEEIAANNVRTILPYLRYQGERVERIARMIEDTNPFRIPRSINGKTLADADKDNMGRPDGLNKTIDLYEESIYQNPENKENTVEAFEKHYRFFKSQEFWTEAAQRKGRPRIKALNEDTLEVFIQELQKIDERILHTNPTHVSRATLQEVYKKTNFDKRVGEFRVLETA